MNNLKKIRYFTNICICFSYSTIIIVIFLEVLSRSLPFLHSLFWPQEVARYMYIWMCFLASSVAISRNAHIGLDVLYIFLPEVIIKLLRILIRFIIILFLLVLTVNGFKMCIINYRQISYSLRISMAIPYLSIPLGSILMIIEELYLLWKELPHSYSPKNNNN